MTVRPKLSRREREIATHVAAGLKNREVAERLGITEQTVKNTLQVIYGKCGVRNRVEFAMYVLRHRLISPEKP
jgi:two-component system, NarL family, nitrate/nitrite response regulator NarL